MNTNDIVLLKKARKGDKSAINSLFETYHRPAFNISCRILGRADIAEDIVMDCFLKVFQNDFQISSNFSAYFYRSVVNASLNQLKKEQKEHISSDDFNYEPTAPDNPENEIQKKAVISRIKQAINELPENQKTAFILIKYQELSYKETAEIMQTTVKALEGLIKRAKENLKEKLKDLL